MVSAAQIATVKSQWGAAGGEHVINIFIHKLLAAHPEHEAKFKNFRHPISDSDPGFQKQVKQTAGALEKAVTFAAAGKDAEYKQFLHDVATKHKSFNVGQAEFQTGKDVIAATAQEAVGSGADVAAWEAVIGDVLDSLK